MPAASVLMNAVPTLTLRAPLVHHAMSHRYLLLQFTGRRSGRRYRTPVAYVRDGEDLLISTDSPWWRNLVARPDVTVRLRGRVRDATTRELTDRREAVAALERLVRGVPGYRRAAGISEPLGDETLRQAIDAGRHVFRVTGASS